MGLDTASKRASGVNLSLPFRQTVPYPSGSFDGGDRQQLLYGYSGIPWGTPAVGPTLEIDTDGWYTSVLSTDGWFTSTIDTDGWVP